MEEEDESRRKETEIIEIKGRRLGRGGVGRGKQREKRGMLTNDKRRKKE